MFDSLFTHKCRNIINCFLVKMTIRASFYSIRVKKTYLLVNRKKHSHYFKGRKFLLINKLRLLQFFVVLDSP